MSDPLDPLDPLAVPESGDPGDPGEIVARRKGDRPSAGGVPAPDPSRVAGHFAGVGDGDLLDLAAREESVRRLLVEVAAVVADVDAEGEASRSTRPPLAGSVRARALAAFAAAVPLRVESSRASSFDGEPGAVGSFGGAPPRSLPAARRGLAWRRVAVAAAVLVATGIGLAVTNRPVEAASLALESLDRVGAAGDVETSGPRRLAVGQRVEAKAGERVALRLVGGTRVVLADRAQMAVGCDAPCAGGCGGAVFELEAGAVVVAAADGRAISPVAVRVPATGRVDVWQGAARVDRDATGSASLSLRSDARVRWCPDGGVARELSGPAVFALVGTSRPGGSATSTAPGAADAAIDATAFRDLEFFGGPLRRLGAEVRVGCRRWRILGEAAPATASASPSPGDGARVAPARRSEMGGAPAIRLDLGAGDVGRLAWPADAPAYGARRLEVRFRALAARASDRTPPTLRVRLEGVPGAEGSVVLEPEAASEGPTNDAPRLRRALLPLPASFRDAPRGLSDLVLSLAVEGGASTVWFESVVFLEVGAAEEASR